jgi:hypothetical protein
MTVLTDAPLMLFGGPMKYLADIGLAYVSIPVVTLGLAAAYAQAERKEVTR